MPHRPGLARGLAAVAGAAALVLIAAMAPASADAGRPSPGPAPATVPGGLAPGAPVAGTGDCELPGVTCRPALAGSCTKNLSQTTPPATIRVLERTGTTTTKIYAVNFENYVEDVLPNEWVETWDGDALKAGAVAVKSYAWYWATHFGGYVGTAANCFDVTDDQDFQVYKPGSRATAPRSVRTVQETWPFVARMNGQVLQTQYKDTLTGQTTEACGAGADGKMLSQYGSQNCVEANTGNKYNVILGKYYFPGLQLATTRQLRTPHDFTFEQTSTRVTFAAGQWSIDDGYPTTMHFGTAGDLPFTTDAGDGFAHMTAFRPSNGTWYISDATASSFTATQFGHAGDVPVPGHYAGLGHASVLSVYRPSNHTWYVRAGATVRYGTTGDIPVPGDYTGDGKTDIAVYRPSTQTWYVQGRAGVRYGERGDIPVPGDYTGDGKTDIAVYRPSTQTWYVQGRAGVHYGAPGDVPVTGDYNGDGRIDLAVYRPSTHTWYSAGNGGAVFGAAGVTLVGRAPYRG